MSTLTLNLEEKVLKTLHDRAAKLGVSVEQYAAALVEDQLQPTSVSAKELRELLDESIREDDEVYRRLAN